MTLLLIEMLDGGIYNLVTDTDSYSGCETCDYGSEYINEFDVYMTEGVLEVRVSSMYEYPLSEGFLMKLFLTNFETIKQMHEASFREWLKTEIEAEMSGDAHMYSGADVEITFREGA